MSQENPNTTTCEEFATTLSDGGFFDTVIDESYWDGGCDTELMWKLMLIESERIGTILIDRDDWDYDKFMYSVYECTEKGLS